MWMVVFYRVRLKDVLLQLTLADAVRTLLYWMLTRALNYPYPSHVSLRLTTLGSEGEITLEYQRGWHPHGEFASRPCREPDLAIPLTLDDMENYWILQRLAGREPHSTTILDMVNVYLGRPNKSCIEYVAYALNVQAHTMEQLIHKVNNYGKSVPLRKLPRVRQ